MDISSKIQKDGIKSEEQWQTLDAIDLISIATFKIGESQRLC